MILFFLYLSVNPNEKYVNPQKINVIQIDIEKLIYSSRALGTCTLYQTFQNTLHLKNLRSVNEHN